MTGISRWIICNLVTLQRANFFLCHYGVHLVVITMIKCNYHELTHSADDYKWVWFIAFETQGPRVCFWPSWISQRTDMWQWYNEWLAQSITWYVFVEWHAFLSGGRSELSIVTWARGHIPIQRERHGLPLRHCLQHSALLSPLTALWQLNKKCMRQKIPTEPDRILCNTTVG